MKSISELGGVGDFIPDALTQTTLHEVKNVGRLQLDGQIRAQISFCRKTGRRFIIHVRPDSKIDSTVISALEAEARLVAKAGKEFKWEILTDIPNEMSVSAQLAK